MSEVRSEPSLSTPIIQSPQVPNGKRVPVIEGLGAAAESYRQSRYVPIKADFLTSQSQPALFVAATGGTDIAGGTRSAEHSDAASMQSRLTRYFSCISIEDGDSVSGAFDSHLQLAREKAEECKDRIVSLVKDPELQRITFATGSGALVLGTPGGAFGAISGVIVGGAAGILPALLTFGLSIPAGALAGGVTGLVVGSTSFGSVGGAAGYGLYRYRIEVKGGIITARIKLMKTTEAGHAKLHALADRTKRTIECYAENVKTKARAAIKSSKVKANEAVVLAKCKADQAATFAKTNASKAYSAATTTRAGVSATAGVAGGAAGSIAGGAMGAVAGAAVGVVPALFTFGLSIPVGATIGLCTGAATGCTAGVVGGSAAGFTGFTYRNEIGATAEFVRSKAETSAGYVHTKAIDSTVKLQENVLSLVRTRK
eukprot:TRINITY_DN13167_c0_g1_i1.p1 TRINITY_DN13167_c0_g1~~TRINITY_DN13167_c0_g1_i1.p1  ORF type:complete len:461 (+),score=100.69 TRINITY_DN13167_c0_g1_i1:101-1384(+)